MSIILVTGAAGFIGFHVTQALLARGDTVVCVDNLNAYYDVSLKEARLRILGRHPNFIFRNCDISNREGFFAIASEFPGVEGIVHLAGQVGVRHSLKDPYAYVQSNVLGYVVMAEVARSFRALRHIVYASSSSVYGSNTKLPFSVADPIETPNSLYAATKRTNELLGHTYAHLYDLPSTGLRFFSVYGPWGRPDMAAFLFTRAILTGEPIRVFNRGEMWRDFTYIDDVVTGVIRALDLPPTARPPHVIYNIGNNKAEKLLDFIAVLEDATGCKAAIVLDEMQAGDIGRTHADIEPTIRDLGFEPATSIHEGIPKFVDWFRGYYKM